MTVMRESQVINVTVTPVNDPGSFTGDKLTGVETQDEGTTLTQLIRMMVHQIQTSQLVRNGPNGVQQ